MLKVQKEVCWYCKGHHAPAICFKLENSLKQNSHIDLEKGKVDVKPTSSNSVLHNRGGVLLQCVKAEVIGHISSDKIFCLFDNGSEKSFIKKNVSQRLGLKKGKCDEQSDCTSVHLIHSEEESISAELRRFWEIESLGIRDNDSVSLGNGDEEILSEFDKSVCFVDGRYRVSLPWKPGMREVLQNNKTVARKRFEGLVRRFKCDHELFCEYKDVIDNYVREGIVERTSCDSLSDSQGFYLPHHAVIRSDKTTSRLRIVFDGSAHEDGHSSLNQSLYTGPNLHPNMLELLLRFLKNPVAFTADVKSAFLQIELDLRDREFTRFFWTDNLNNDPYVLNFTRVLFGLRPSPYLLAATLKHHFKKYKEQYPHTFDLLNSSIYVDDFICGRNDVPDALRTTLECLQIFSDASMLLRKWRTNSKQLDLLWQQEGVETEFSETSATDLKPPIKVLGLAWDSEKDLIYFDPKDLLKFMSRKTESKRFNLSVVGRIFDPIGILGPFVIKLKCLLQDLWTLGVDWDSELPPKLRHKWQQWNASKSAYGTILYLRFVTCNNKIETSFICSKSRVAPLKSLTLPRLELTAALLSARLAKQVSSCLKFNANTYYWTDSLISYYWIRGDSSAFKPYIKNRVQEIQLLSDPSQWGHCPGKDNPSDLISRGTSAVKLAQNELWWHGPPWLKLTPDHWPNRHRDILDSELCSEELEYRSSVHVAVTQQRESLVDINRFSSLKKLLKVTAWVFRFVNNARIINKSMNFYITADEIQNAEYFWLKYVQYEFYSAEILTLKRNEQLRCSSEIKSLVPYLGEDNLLKELLDGCLKQTYALAKSILLSFCKFTELLVIREHERIGHCGVSATLTQLRKNYWIPKGRQLVKTIIRICLICKKYNAKLADQLSGGQLPRDRITQSPPFQIVGIDFTGAILVKDNQETHKSYVSLFTCAVTRAVHLELISDMSTKCFLLALRRFLARRGNCKVIYSDNARTFKAAEKELAYFANILKDSEFQNFVADKGIHWKFIVERAPWWGGFYERLVKTIKDPLRKILGKALLMFEELSTILSEVEVIVNHRPLTYVENDPGEPEPLTPAHFLELGCGDSKYPIHFIELIDATTARESYKKRKTYRTLLLKQLWRRWKEQYLLQLKTVNHFKTPSVHKNLKLNDIVLVEGNVKSKLLWELGIIKKIFIGRDNNVRSCLVKTSKGLFKKPIQLLYPLELE
ncbi:integrase catalytic domain-containing protein [Trichonephila clavata]|uniref:Integrase catalytic domain-containing protein n=1 Tax=Trichonephila clavata TaxID=2740835 RepID=A0A8X6FYM8_TRICU|nr:integrase catalytic domain-containing protein [Trichonephila clavata]